MGKHVSGCGEKNKMINGKTLISFDGTKIYYRYRNGRSTPLVFIHGIGGNSSAWVPILNHFESQGYSTLYVDVRGHGKSDKPRDKRYYKLENCCLDLREIFKKEGIHKAVLVGHSSGGAIALKFEQLCPAYVKSIILITSFYTTPLKHFAIPLKPLTIPVKFVASIVALIARVLPRYKLKYTAYYKYRDSSEFYLLWKDILGTPIETFIYSFLMLLDYDLSNHMKKIKMPVLIIAGKRDWITKLSGSKRMHRMLPDSQLVILDKTEHDLLFKTPEQIWSVIESFIVKKSLVK